MTSQDKSAKKIENIDETQKRAQVVLNKILPSLHADGGDAKIVGLSSDGILSIKLLGACGGCPMSQMTLKQGIERIIREEVPEIVSVEAA